MTEISKKEIFDYLRNIQKSAEIEAKVNGVNIWALLGAAAFVSWQLLGSTVLWDGRNFELILRTLVSALALYCLKSMLTPGRRKDDVRFLSLGYGDPYMWILSGIASCAPLVLYAVHIERNIIHIFPFSFGVLAIVFGMKILFRSHVDERQNADKLPNPVLSFTSRFDWVLGAIVVAAFAWIFIEQMSRMITQVSPDVAKSLVLVAVLYLLVLTIIDRRSQYHSLVWTYELETDLLLNVITPEIALRRIEHRRLGQRLRDVMDEFCADLDARFTAFDEALKQCLQPLATANEIPEQYGHERRARIEEALAGPRGALKGLARDAEKFSRYINGIEEKYKLAKREPVFQAALKILFERQKDYEMRIKAAHVKLDTLAGVNCT